MDRCTASGPRLWHQPRWDGDERAPDNDECQRIPYEWEGEPNTVQCFNWWAQWLSDEDAAALGLTRGDPENPVEVERCPPSSWRLDDDEQWSVLLPPRWPRCDVLAGSLERAQRHARVGDLQWVMAELATCVAGRG